MTHDVSVLIGGKAGEGITSAGALVAQLLNHHGYAPFLSIDYPSLIRGGHNFALVRGAGGAEAPATCRDSTDFILALDQTTVKNHRHRQDPGGVIIFNADVVRAEGLAVPVRQVLADEKAPEIMGNTVLIGGFAKAAGIPWETAEGVLSAHIPKGTDLNIRVARRAYDLLPAARPLPRGSQPPRPLVTGNEAIALGLVRGGLDAYVSYPMTPSSGILHFLAQESQRFGLTVVHPENEIAVILMALGFAAAGKRAAVGTSGGGFCLMTEGLSLAGMAELPVLIVMSQRTGPSTGLPTYTGQADLPFVLHAGQGEFPRLVVAPMDADEALLWSARALDLAWRFQVPAFVLADKTLSEGMYCLTPPGPEELSRPPAVPVQSGVPYRRYADTPDGVSPLVPPGTPGAVVKVNSYAHDEDGITTEDAAVTARMAEKRLRKGQALKAALDRYPQVRVTGTTGAPVALLAWGSTGGACTETGGRLGLRTVRPLVLAPFPGGQLAAALQGTTRVIAVEENSTGQLADIVLGHGIPVHDRILRYDGRPFTAGSLEARVREVLLS